MNNGVFSFKKGTYRLNTKSKSEFAMKKLPSYEILIENDLLIGSIIFPVYEDISIVLVC